MELHRHRHDFISGYTNSATGFSSASVNIFPDATNPQLDHVNVTASTNLPTWFMRWFGYTTLNISATGNAPGAPW